jgi:hypothetical protein
MVMAMPNDISFPRHAVISSLSRRTWTVSVMAPVEASAAKRDARP